MRQLFVQVPREQGEDALSIARQHGGRNVTRMPVRSETGEAELITLSLDNAALEVFITKVQSISDLRVTFAPQGVLSLGPPADRAPEQVEDVGPRSPIEVFLSGLQSVGSWKGFLGYAFISGVVAWIGLFTNTSYLLTAAMLIAPFAGPAMNAALATARGDGKLLGRSVARYFASLAISIAVAAALSLVFGQNVATTQMVETSQLSTAAVLLPLSAGAAGALNLSQSERSSLVSGAATGMLVAASLAPPAALIGMAAALGRWDLAHGGAFLILLQIAGINLSGALVFRSFGLKPEGARYARGTNRTFAASITVTATALTLLLGYQFWDRPSLQRSTRSQRAASLIHEEVSQSGLASLVEANVRFTRAEIPEQETLLCVVYVQRSRQNTLSASEIAHLLTQRIQRRLVHTEGFEVSPLIDVTVLEGP